jgi:FkbM family methyltransferase
MTDWAAAEGISRTAPYIVPPYALHYGDEAEIRDAYWRIEPGDTVIDVGARYGSYTIPALAAGARVCAIDLEGWVLELLAQAAKANGFDALTTMCIGLYDGTPYPAGLAADIARTANVPSYPPGAIQWSTLDEIADGRVDWVKIDVEGAELAVLKGGLRTLREHHPRLVIEDHTRVYPWVRKHRIAKRMHGILESLGYQIESIPYSAETGAPRDFTIAT